MHKKRQRSRSEDEEEKENQMEKRLKRLEDAILHQRGNKRHKKRRRRRRSSRSSSSEAEDRQRSRGRSQVFEVSSKGSSVADQWAHPGTSYHSTTETGQEIGTQSGVLHNSSTTEQVLDQTATQAGIVQSSSVAGLVTHQTVTKSVLVQDSPAVEQLGQQTVVATQSGSPQRLNTVGQAGQQIAPQSVTAQPFVVTTQVSQSEVSQLDSSQNLGVTGQGSQSAESAISEVSLDPEILEVLGKRFLEDQVLAAAIPKDLVVRWEEILKKGLPTEERDSLIKKYPPPSNGVIIDPPRVNPEVQASLHESVVKRDERILAKQTKITACLAAIGKTFLKVLEGGGEMLLILEQLSDASRLLSDLLHDESVIRKSLILANLNVSCKDTLNATIPDEWLFGKQLEEKLKAAKALESSRKELKPTQKPQGPRNSKNSRPPPRRPQNTQKSSTTSGGRKESRSQGYGSYRRDNRKNDSGWQNNQKSERSSNRKRY